MDIYMLHGDSDNYALLEYDDKEATRWISRARRRGERLADRWDTPTVHRSEYPGLAGNPMADILSTQRGDAVNAHAVEVLGDLLDGHVELLPLAGLDEAYWLVNPTTYQDALDVDATGYSPSGAIRTPVLDARRLDPDVHLFCVPQRPARPFVTDMFVDRLESAELTGWWLRGPYQLSHADQTAR